MTQDMTEYPVHTSNEHDIALEAAKVDELESQPTREKLVSELNMAMKAKVDLLRELTKANKEYFNSID